MTVAPPSPAAPTSPASGGIRHLRRKDLAPADREALDRAVADPDRFRSREKDLAGPLVLVLAALVTGAGIALGSTDWSRVADAVRSGRLVFLRHELGPLGLVAALGAIAGVAAFWRHVHGRWGYAVLPDALARVRGDRVVFVRRSDIASTRVRSGDFRIDPHHLGRGSRRRWRSLEITGHDGTHVSFDEVLLYQDLLATRDAPHTGEMEETAMHPMRTRWTRKRNGWTYDLEVGPASVSYGRDQGTIESSTGSRMSLADFLDGKNHDILRREHGRKALQEALDVARVLAEQAAGDGPGT